MQSICSTMRTYTAGLLLGMIGLAAGCSALAAADPNALWQIVSIDCVPAARTTGKTGICTSVDLAGHYAILKDRSGASQHLLIPTDRISGIESPRVLAPDSPNYWADAWDARSFVEASLKAAKRGTVTDDRLGIEINSAFRRSQEQLHIHIDCMRPEVTDALARHRDDALNTWRWDTIDNVRYRIMRVPGPALNVDPFRVVAHDSPGPDAMAGQTILVTGAGESAQNAGWFIVNSSIDVGGGTGSAEGLLDHQCVVAAKE